MKSCKKGEWKKCGWYKQFFKKNGVSVEQIRKYGSLQLTSTWKLAYADWISGNKLEENEKREIEWYKKYFAANNHTPSLTKQYQEFLSCWENEYIGFCFENYEELTIMDEEDRNIHWYKNFLCNKVKIDDVKKIGKLTSTITWYKAYVKYMETQKD